jgi:hypothetical protein
VEDLSMFPAVAVGPAAPRRAIFSRWLAATSLGFLLGYLAARATRNLGLTPLTPLSAAPRWLFSGLVAAALLSRLLGPVLPRARTWVVVTGAAFALAGPIAAIPSAEPMSYGITWAVGGALIGTIQWLALRRMAGRPRWWPLTTLIGFGAGGLTYGSGFYLVPEDFSRSLASIILWVLTGFVTAVVTGGALAGTRRVSADPSHPQGHA